MLTIPPPKFGALLRILRANCVDFIVVGSVAGVLQGAPLSTFDLDVVHSRAATNLDRLLATLDELDACYRGQGTRKLKPDRSHLASGGYQLLITRSGPLDLLGIVGNNLDYDALLSETREMDVGDGLKVKVLNLDALIRIKEQSGRDKDKAALPLLRRTLEEEQAAGQFAQDREPER